MTGECGFSVDGSNKLGTRFFNQHIQKCESQVRFFFESKAERRVSRVEAGQEQIAFIFVADYYKGVIHITVIHLRFGSSLKKFRFAVINKNIGKGWSKNKSKVGPGNCTVYLRLPWLGSTSTWFKKQVKSAVKQCFSAVEPRVVYSTNELLFATNKDVLPALQKSHVINSQATVTVGM